MSNKKNNQRSEFIHLQFIRNSNDDICKEKSRFVAFDYFDYIYAEKMNCLKECLSKENSFSCEAYQKLSIFKLNVETDKGKSPFEDDNTCELPFLSVLQVTITPEKYSTCDKKFDESHLEDCEKELESHITFLCDKLTEYNNDFKFRYRIYRSVNTADFCIVLSSNMLEFSLYLSTDINSIIVNNNAKYVVYTVMGVRKEFDANQNVIIKDSSIMVARIRLNRNLRGMKNDWEKLNARLQKSDNDTHGLIGRYDLSVRVSGKSNIVYTLENLIKYKNNHNAEIKPYFNKNTAVDILAEENLNSTAFISWLLKNKYAEYVNERILFDTDTSLVPKTQADLYISDTPEHQMQDLFDCFKDVKKAINTYSLEAILGEYISKLGNMVHICVGLYSTYDTQINVLMFKNYLIAFMKMFIIACDAVQESNEWINVKLNLIEGLNSLQQFIKIVTSINGSSFQSPKYDIVQQECSIEKFPIAYSEFMSEMCHLYYLHRKEIADDEFEYYPRYNALMIPLMTSKQGDFAMTILFSQGISRNWNTEKRLWKRFIENEKYELPIFVTCQNLETYLDVSGVIVASFHELGHYCNSIGRKKRNETVLEIAASLVSKSIMKAYSYSSHSLFPVQLYALHSDNQFKEFHNIVYTALVQSFRKYLDDYISCPYILFMEKLSTCISEILKPSPPYYEDINIQNQYIKYLEQNARYKYHTNTRFHGKSYEIKNHVDFLKEISTELFKKANQIEEGIKKESLNNNKPMPNDWETFVNDINKFIQVAKDHTESFIFEEADIDLSELFKNIEANYDKIKNSTREKIILSAAADLKDMIHYIGYNADQVSLIILNDKHTDKSKKSGITTELIEDIKNDIPFLFIDNPYMHKTLAADLKNKLFLRTEVTADGLSALISEACYKSSFDDNELNAWYDAYAESMADIVMCMNLSLGIVEYLVFITDIYFQYINLQEVYIKRILLVVSFLYINHKRADLRTTEINLKDVLYEQIKSTQMNSKLKSNSHIADYMAKFNEVCNAVLDNNNIISDSTFHIILESLVTNCYNVDFLGEQKQEFAFVKQYLLNKILDDSQSKDNKNMDTQEIKFILDYYYKTRMKYGKHLEEKNENNS